MDKKQLMNKLSEAMHFLYSTKKAVEDIVDSSIIEMRITHIPFADDNMEVLCYHPVWIALGGFEQPYQVKRHICSLSNNDGVQERTYELSFNHRGIRYFCLMSEDEVLQYVPEARLETL